MQSNLGSSMLVTLQKKSLLARIKCPHKNSNCAVVIFILCFTTVIIVSYCFDRVRVQVQAMATPGFLSRVFLFHFEKISGHFGLFLGVSGRFGKYRLKFKIWQA